MEISTFIMHISYKHYIIAVYFLSPVVCYIDTLYIPSITFQSCCTHFYLFLSLCLSALLHIFLDYRYLTLASLLTLIVCLEPTPLHPADNGVLSFFFLHFFQSAKNTQCHHSLCVLQNVDGLFMCEPFQRLVVDR